MIPTLPAKQPGEAWYVPFDFSGPLDSSYNPDRKENLGKIVDVKAEETDTGEDVSDVLVDESICQIDGKIAYVWVQNGEDGKRYKITCRVEAQESKQVFEHECFVVVREA